MTEENKPAQGLYSPEAAAEWLDVSRTVVYGLIKRGELKSVKIGSRRRVPAAALAAYVASLEGAA